MKRPPEGGPLYVELMRDVEMVQSVFAHAALRQNPVHGVRGMLLEQTLVATSISA